MAEMNVLEVSHLVKRFGALTAVDDVSLEVGSGRFVGLLGPNGAGKSTMLKCITGLIRPTSGSITINGLDISNHRDAMRSVGCVIETPETYLSFTPSELLEYIGRTYGLNDRQTAIRARDVLEQVDLWEWRNQKVGKFSKGMRQRAMLAQAMLSNPDLLILDEPTSGLDPRGMVDIREVLMDLKGYGCSLLISTHMLKEVSQLCDSVTMINHGKVIASDDINVLLRQYRENRDAVRIIVKTKNPLTDASVADISEVSGVRSIQRFGDYELRIDFSGNDEDRPRISNTIFEHGLGLLSMSEDETDIEGLYMELTGRMEGQE